MALAEQAYRETTVAELLQAADSVTPLCEIPKLTLNNDELPSSEGSSTSKSPKDDSSQEPGAD